MKGRKLLADGMFLLKSAFSIMELSWKSAPVPVLIVSLLIVSLAFFPIGLAWLAKMIFDMLGEVLGGQQPQIKWNSLLTLILIQMFLSVVERFLSPAQAHYSNKIGLLLSLKIRTLIHEKLLSFKGISELETPSFYNKLKLAQSGAEQSSYQILGLLTGSIRSLITLIGFLGILLAIQPLVAVLLLISALPQLVIELKLGTKRYALSQWVTTKERHAFFFDYILSSIHAVKEVRLFGLGNYFLGRMVEDYQKLNSEKQKQSLLEFLWGGTMGTLSVLVANGALIFVILNAFSGNLTLGDLTLFIAAVSSVQGAVGNIVTSVARLHESSLLISSYDEVMKLPQSLQVRENIRPVPVLQKGIEFRNVWFRYPGSQRWILEGINLTLSSRKCTALVGTNGVGKTTLVKLLARFYDPTEGEILWDGIDIRNFCPDEYRERIGAVFQDFVRYDLTARENIGLGKIKQIANIEAVEHAAASADIDRIISQLPYGYETYLSRTFLDHNGDEGVDLSGGEWQRVALARMFIRNADFLILDEPTASLDAQAEYDLHTHFGELISGHTSLIISHRFSTIQMADYIAVIEAGKISEFDTHFNLLNKGGTYKELYAMEVSKYLLHDRAV